GYDDRKSKKHSFINDQAPGFSLSGGQHKNICYAVIFTNFRLVYKSCQNYPMKLVFFTIILQFLSKFSVTNHDEGNIFICQQRIGFKQIHGPFLSNIFSRKKNDGSIFWQS